jgi:mRNA interferase HigB
MRIISLKTLRQFWRRYADAKTPLRSWFKTSKAARWDDLTEVRATFPTADPVIVASGNTVTVFNIGGNKYRLITAIHYNTGVVFVLMVLTHAEYSRDKWKDRL